jgi:hypothetical protein
VPEHGAVEREDRAVAGAVQLGRGRREHQATALVRADSRYRPELAAGPFDEAGQRAHGEETHRALRQVGAGQHGLPAAPVGGDRGAGLRRGRGTGRGEQVVKPGADGGRAGRARRHRRGPHEGAARAALGTRFPARVLEFGGQALVQAGDELLGG